MEPLKIFVGSVEYHRPNSEWAGGIEISVEAQNLTEAQAYALLALQHQLGDNFRGIRDIRLKAVHPEAQASAELTEGDLVVFQKSDAGLQDVLDQWAVGKVHSLTPSLLIEVDDKRTELLYAPSPNTVRRVSFS